MKTFLKSILVLAFFAFCFANVFAVEETPKQKTQNETQKTSIDIVKAFTDWDNNLRTLSCSFTQTITFTEADITNVITGSIKYKKPNHLRLEHISPYKQVVYTDKQTIQIYKPADNQVILARWSDWLNQQKSQAYFGLLDFGHYSSILKGHNITTFPAKNGQEPKLVLTPKDNPKQYALTIFLDKRDFFPTRLVLVTEGTKVFTILGDISKNEKMDDKIFTFNPPEGVEELRLY
jgi:chaperone LolA